MLKIHYFYELLEQHNLLNTSLLHLASLSSDISNAYDFESHPGRREGETQRQSPHAES